MFCKQCGQKNDQEDKFCRNCGAPLQETKEEKSNIFKAKKSKPVLLIVGIIALVAILFFARDGSVLLRSDTIIECAGYTFIIPREYEAEIIDKVALQITETKSQEKALTYIYEGDYNQLKQEFMYIKEYSLESYVTADNGTKLVNVEEETVGTEDVLFVTIANENRYSTIAVFKLSDEYMFFIQTVNNDLDTSKELLLNLIPIIKEATPTGETISPYNNNSTISLFDLLRK